MAAAFHKQFLREKEVEIFPQKNLDSQMKQHLLLSVGENTQTSLVLIVAGKSWD